MNRGAAPPVSSVMEAGITSAWRWARPVGGALVLAALALRLGADPFVAGLRAVDTGTVTVVVAIAVVTTVGAAWRWHVVARGLQAPLPLGSAIGACYRAQFLNLVLPGGVLGDVDRGVRHGRELHDLGRGLRAVVWERAAGQVVLAVVAAFTVALASPFSDLRPPLSGWAPTVLIVAVLLFAAIPVAVGLARSDRGRRVLRRTLADTQVLARPALLARVVLASLVVLTGHLMTFWLAARAVGVRMPSAELLPVAVVVLLVAGLPLNLAGWGPREGAAAWAFAATGAGSGQGVAVAVAYGAMVFVATLPGAVFLVRGRSRRLREEMAAHG